MNNETYLTEKAVRARVGVSHPTLHRWRKAGQFPNPVRLGPRRVGYRESDVAAWENARADVKPKGATTTWRAPTDNDNMGAGERSAHNAEG